MNVIKNQKNRKLPMKHKLFLYMLTLAVILLVFLACGIFILGNFTTAKQSAEKTLAFQMQSFDRQISKYFEDMTRLGSSLSSSVSKKTDAYLTDEGIDFDDLNDDATRLNALQRILFNILSTELLKTDCSGAFIMLNATVNTHIEGAENSKSGLYFQRASLDESDETLLLFRGNSEIGRENGVMPHRKWRLEFNTERFPNFKRFLTGEPITNASPYLTNVFNLYGTSEKTINFIVPIISASGKFYGLCGFEISQNFFKQFFAQPTQLEHLTCMLFSKNGNEFNMENGFAAGVYKGYYLPPQGKFTVKDIGDGIVTLNGNQSYVAKIQNTKICNEDYVLMAAYPKAEYDETVRKNATYITLFILLLVTTTCAVCVFFSRRFLRPLLKGIEQIRKQEHKTARSEFVEIDDLFSFLAEQDRLHDEETTLLRTRCDEQGNMIEQNQADISRLAYSRKNEVSPDDYEQFKLGIKTLTKTEKQIFGLYLSGKTAEEIMDICGIQKGTLKYHNHNILGKLGVTSRKQMLRYATLLKQENDGTL